RRADERGRRAVLAPRRLPRRPARLGPEMADRPGAPPARRRPAPRRRVALGRLPRRRRRPLFPLTLTLPVDAGTSPPEGAAFTAMMLGGGYTLCRSRRSLSARSATPPEASRARPWKPGS